MIRRFSGFIDRNTPSWHSCLSEYICLWLTSSWRLFVTCSSWITKGSVRCTPKMKRSVNYVKKRGINPYQSTVAFRTKDMMKQALSPYE